MYDDIILFVELIKSGSYTKTSQQLDIPQPTVSRRIKHLEDKMGIKLLSRNTHQMKLTKHGQILFDRFKYHDKYLLDVIQEIAVDEKSLSGRLDVLLPIAFANDFINDNLEKFCTQYPSIKLNISYQNKIDLLKDDFDLIVTAMMPKAQKQKIRKIYSNKLVMACTKEYQESHGTPETISELKKHKLIAPTDIGNISTIYNSKNQISQVNMLNPTLNVNSTLMALTIIKKNNFIAILLEHQVAQNNLVRILPKYNFGSIDYYLIKNNLHKNIRIDAFAEFIDSCISSYK